jgi:hypothetical protein
MEKDMPVEQSDWMEGCDEEENGGYRIFQRYWIG